MALLLIFLFNIIELNYKVEYIGGKFEIDGSEEYLVPGCAGVRMFFQLSAGEHDVKITKGQLVCKDKILVEVGKKVYTVNCDGKANDNE